MGESVDARDGEPSGVGEGRILETLNRTDAALSAELDLEHWLEQLGLADRRGDIPIEV